MLHPVHPHTKVLDLARIETRLLEGAVHDVAGLGQRLRQWRKQRDICGDLFHLTQQRIDRQQAFIAVRSRIHQFHRYFLGEFRQCGQIV